MESFDFDTSDRIAAIADFLLFLRKQVQGKTGEDHQAGEDEDRDEAPDMRAREAGTPGGREAEEVTERTGLGEEEGEEASGEGGEEEGDREGAKDGDPEAEGCDGDQDLGRG